MPLDTLVLTSQTLANVVDPRKPAEYVAYEPRAFAKSNLTLSMDAKGRLTSLTQATGSSMAELATGLAGAATNVRDQYAGTIAKAAEVEDNRRKLRLSDLQTQLELAKKRKELVDARVGLAGASSTEGLLKEQAEAAAELNLANTRLSLEKVQASSATQVEVEILTQEVNRLRQEIEVLKQQQALKALQDANK